MALDLKNLSLKKSDSVDNDGTVKLSKKQQAAMDKPFVVTLPFVNLLSDDVKEVVEQQRLKKLFLSLAGGLVAVIVVVFIGQQGLISHAQNKLDDANQTSSKLSAQENTLTPVKAYYTQIDANVATIQTTMAKEVLLSQVISNLTKATPAGITLSNTSITVDSGATAGAVAPTDPTGTTGASSACPSQDPYNQTAGSAGCISVDGVANSRATLGAWLDSLKGTDTFTVAFIPSTTASTEGGGVSFTATIGLSTSVYQDRYSNPDFLKIGTN